MYACGLRGDSDRGRGREINCDLRSIDTPPRFFFGGGFIRAPPAPSPPLTPSTLPGGAAKKFTGKKFKAQTMQVVMIVPCCLAPSHNRQLILDADTPPLLFGQGVVGFLGHEAEGSMVCLACTKFVVPADMSYCAVCGNCFHAQCASVFPEFAGEGRFSVCVGCRSEGVCARRTVG